MPIPESIGFWDQFPQHSRQWLSQMEACGLSGGKFQNFAQDHTRLFTLGYISPRVIGSDTDANYLLCDYFYAVNDFNYSYYQFLEPSCPPVEPYNQVYVSARSAFGLNSNSPFAITDGSHSWKAVGLGAVKTPWDVTRSSIHQFLSRMPYNNFGDDFVAVTPLPQACETLRCENEEMVRLGTALVKLYGDLLAAHLSLGFLATPDGIFYCCIPEDRSRFNIHYCEISWADKTSELEAGETCPFTPQVGLATLAWLAKRFYGRLYKRPRGLQTWRRNTL
jgi:hypothetical protein